MEIEICCCLLAPRASYCAHRRAPGGRYGGWVAARSHFLSEWTAALWS